MAEKSTERSRIYAELAESSSLTRADVAGVFDDLVKLMRKKKVARTMHATPRTGDGPEPLVQEPVLAIDESGEISLESPSTETPPTSWRHELDQIEDDILDVRELFVERFKRVLGMLEGKSLDKFEENQSVATRIQGILAFLGQCVLCTKCGRPAKLRCQKSGRTRAGAFVFEHSAGGSLTFHYGSKAIPRLELSHAPKSRKSGVQI